MEAEFCLFLLLIISGCIPVEGARPENQQDSSIHKRAGECSFFITTSILEIFFMVNWQCQEKESAYQYRMIISRAQV